MSKTEVQQFFEDLPSEDKNEQDIFGEKQEEIKPQEEPKEEKPVVEEDFKNRRYRRLEQKFNSERDSNIALNERIRSLSENKAPTKREPYEEWKALYGDSEKSREAYSVQDKLFRQYLDDFRGEIREEIEREQFEAENEEAQYEDFIEDELASIEDNYSVDLSSNTGRARKLRKELLETIEELSPKDDEGNIIEYADFDSAFKLLQRNQVKNTDSDRQKDLASRSTNRSTNAQPLPTPEGPVTFENARSAISRLFNR